MNIGLLSSTLVEILAGFPEISLLQILSFLIPSNNLMKHVEMCPLLMDMLHTFWNFAEKTT
jgi:hypothetical protein